jgi:hypothetical protein
MTEHITSSIGKNTDEIGTSIEAAFRDVSRLNLKLAYLARANLEWFLSSNVEFWELTAKETRKQFDLFKEVNRDFGTLLNKEIREIVHSRM